MRSTPGVSPKKKFRSKFTSTFSNLKFHCIAKMSFYSVGWWLVKGNKSHGTEPRKSETTQTIYFLVDWCFICSIDLKYSGVFSNCHFSTHGILDSLLCSFSHSLNLLLSFSLSLSSAHSPLCFYLPPFHIKGYWFVWSGSLNKHIWMNIVPHLGLAHNSSDTLSRIRSYKSIVFLNYDIIAQIQSKC
jgi:hypothetical protein